MVDGAPLTPTLPLFSLNFAPILSMSPSAGMPALNWALLSIAPISLIPPSLFSCPLTSPSPSSPRALLWALRDLKKSEIAMLMMRPTASRQRAFIVACANST
eukprot:scaffold45531_cov63-Phaeocystis_antarctica.AAC.7